MNLEDKFIELKEKKEGAYMVHTYYGDPTEEFSIKLIKTLVESGADIIEFGIPFSDPTADGPIFQAACERALENGITPLKCIEGVKALGKAGLDVPIVVTTYYNIPYVFGIEKFFSEISKAGAQAIIIPNLPIEEAGPILEAGKKNRIHIIFQVTPTTTYDRLEKITEVATGFIYVVNFEGVTGVRKSIENLTLNLVTRVREHTNIPLVAGFGISKKNHAKAVVSAGADGVVTGSALAKIYSRNLEHPERTLPELAEFARQIKRGCNEGYRQRLLRKMYKYKEGY